MKLAYDLHIHTALSPCADAEMTPNNIVNMAILKELDVIAITDHNSIHNCKPCLDVAADKGLVVIPGMELQTKEEVHIICLFKNLDSALAFFGLIEGRSVLKNNIPHIFGDQLIFNCKDEIIRVENRMLISSVDLSINEACRLIRELDGLAFPAHIDRATYSIISNLGFIPKELPFKTVEVTKGCSDKFLYRHPELKDYKLIKNSDAHYLADIMEKESFIEAEEKSIECIFYSLGNIRE